MKMHSLSLSLLAGAAFATAALTAPSDARAGCDNQGSSYIGEICAVSFSFCPVGTVEAAGQLMSIQGNEALFSLVGATFGGDGRTTFGIPDLRGRTPIGVGQGNGLNGVDWGEMVGSETRTLTAAQMPMHTHAATVTAPGGGAPTLEVSNASPSQATPAANTYLSAKPITNQGGQVMLFTTDGTSTTAISGISGGGGGVTVTNANAGGSQAFDIVGPRLGLLHCIVTEGLYPPRS